MRTSVSIARQSTSTIAAAAAEPDWTTASWSRWRSASTTAPPRGGPAERDRRRRSEARELCASSNASSVLNRRAIASRCENGSSTAPEAARAKPGVPAPCHPGGAPVDSTGVRIASVYTTWLLGPGGADQGSKATGCGSPPIPGGRMPHGSAAGGGATAPVPGAPRSRRGRERRRVRCALARPEKWVNLRHLVSSPGRWPKRRSAGQAHRVRRGSASSRTWFEPLRVGSLRILRRAERARCSPSGSGDTRCTACCCPLVGCPVPIHQYRSMVCMGSRPAVRSSASPSSANPSAGHRR